MIAIAYTDGSFKTDPVLGGIYSGACILATTESGNQSTLLTKADNDPQLIKHRNISGEISAVMMACEHCMNVLNMKQGDILVIRHDYVGLDYWCRKKGEEGYWKAKNTLSITYRDYINSRVRTRFSVKFEHVAAHTGNTVNEAVDAAAKKAIDDFILRKCQLEGAKLT